MTRFFRSLSLFFTALSAGFALARFLQAQLKTSEQKPGRDAAMTDSTLELAGAALNGAALFSMFGLLVFGRNRKATLVSMASMAANDALWIMPTKVEAPGALNPATLNVDLETGTEIPQEWQETPPAAPATREAARAALQAWSLASLIIASQQPPARKTVLERLRPQAKRLSKKAAKIAPGPVSQVEDTVHQLQPVAERILQEVRKQAPVATHEAKERTAAFIEHAQPIAQRFLERAQQHAPSSKEVRGKAAQVVHDAPSKAHRFSPRQLLKAS